MTKTKQKSAAVITVFDASMMTKLGRKRIATWLRKQADSIEQFGTEYAKRFTARYRYR